MSAQNTDSALARDVAEWLDDGTGQDAEETLADAYALLETLRRKGWRFSVALGWADYTGRVPRAQQ